MLIAPTNSCSSPYSLAGNLVTPRLYRLAGATLVDHQLRARRFARRTNLREKLIKIGAKVVGHGRYVTFQMAEVAVPRRLFAEILSLIARLRAPPAPA